MMAVISESGEDRLSPLVGECQEEVGKLVEIDVQHEGVGYLNTDELESTFLYQTLEKITPSNFKNGKSSIPIQCSSPRQTVQTIETTVSTNEDNLISSVDPPKLGMLFKGWKDIEVYYKMYVEQCGFGVSRVQGSFTTAKERRGVTWRCECWGAPDMRAKREAKKRAKLMEVGGSAGTVKGSIGEDELARGKRKSKKCECLARIYGSVNVDGLWVLKTVVLEHTHSLSPSMANLVKEYRMKKMTSSIRRRLVNYYEVGVPVSQIQGCLRTENEDVPSVKDLQHEVYKHRRLNMAGGDARAMMAYFCNMQSDNQNFYHASRLDEEGRLKDVMWVDARSRVAYEDFGDVVCFDATYLTNEYEFPFANFIGVIHHGQSTLLGCALISHEDYDTYRWVFEQWLAYMGK